MQIKKIYFLFIIFSTLFFISKSSSQEIFRENIAFLYLNNVSGRGGDNLEENLYSYIAENLKKQQNYNLLKIEDLKKILKDKGLEKVLNYLYLLDNSVILKLGKILNVDKILFGNILNYQEIITKEKSSVFIQMKLNLLNIKNNNLGISFEVSGSSEVKGKKKGEASKKEAYKNLFDNILKKFQGEEIKEEKKEYIGNTKSLLLHSPGVNHLPPEEERIYFGSLKEAKEKGYKLCPICFPEFLPSTESADKLEISLAQEISGVIEYYYRILPDQEKIKYLNEVGNKILKITERQNLRYVFNILNTDEINAFAAGAGYIYITKGMLDIIESEDELAGVLAHEIAHVVKKHIVRQYERDQKLSLLATTAVILSGGGQSQSSLIADFAQFLIMRGYDRKYEKEADEVAIFYLIKANYNPYSYIRVLKKIQDLEKTQPSKIEIYFNTHPPVAERIKRAEEYLKNWDEVRKKIEEILGG
jgi:Zn-dependent protease with chaperone function